MSIGLINPNEPDINRRINENLNIFFSSNKMVNYMIDNKIEIVNEFLINNDLKLNTIKLKKYIIKIFKKYLFNKIISVYDKYQNYLYDYITDELIININNKLLSYYIDIEYDLKIYDININYYAQIFDKYYNEINMNISKDMFMLNSFYNTYLFYSGYSYNKNIELDYLILSDSVESLSNKCDIKYNELNELNKNLMIDYKEQKKINKETNDIIKLLSESFENNNNLILLLINENLQFRKSIKNTKIVIVVNIILTTITILCCILN